MFPFIWEGLSVGLTCEWLERIKNQDISCKLADVALLDLDLEESKVNQIILSLWLIYLFWPQWLYDSSSLCSFLCTHFHLFHWKPGNFTPHLFSVRRGLEPPMPSCLPGLWWIILGHSPPLSVSLSFSLPLP